jgi:hypothetical protein
MKYLLGLSIALIGFYQASDHLGQAVNEYWDFVAFFVVLFGTTAVLSISFPNHSVSELGTKFLQKFFLGNDSLKSCASKCANIFSSQSPIKKPRFIEEILLNDGVELISLNFNKERIEDLLTQRYQNYSRKINLLISWLSKNSSIGQLPSEHFLLHYMYKTSLIGIPPKGPPYNLQNLNLT